MAAERPVDYRGPETWLWTPACCLDHFENTCHNQSGDRKMTTTVYIFVSISFRNKTVSLKDFREQSSLDD